MQQPLASEGRFIVLAYLGITIAQLIPIVRGPVSFCTVFYKVVYSIVLVQSQLS